jgi:hypothetical protein
MQRGVEKVVWNTGTETNQAQTRTERDRVGQREVCSRVLYSRRAREISWATLMTIYGPCACGQVGKWDVGRGCQMVKTVWGAVR